jgi:aminoglycoside phosphotransferase (APT) family kinase protein
VRWSWSPDRLERLGRFLSERDLCGSELSAQEVGEGHSNLTYVVSDGERRVVVRRPPPPPFPPGAHDVLREARLVTALATTNVPVPKVLAIADADAVVDVPLVVTEFIDGLVITEATPASLSQPTIRRQIAERAVDTLADLHSVDWKALGLNDFGRPEGFNLRHLRRVSGLVSGRHGSLPDAFVPLAEWLERNAPTEARAAIVHNDYRLGNLMYARRPPADLAAVLDWELATIGDPLFDLGYFLSSIPSRDEPLTPITAMATAALESGFPARDELLARYRTRTGTDPEAIHWYSALAQFKLAALYEYRRCRGNGADGDAYFANSGMVSSLLRAGEALAS